MYEEDPDSLLAFVKKVGNVHLLTRMSVTDSLDRNLRQEDREIANEYNLMSKLVHGKGSELDTADDKGKDDMLVAGDYNVTIEQEKLSQPSPQTAPQNPTPAAPTQSKIRDMVLSALAGAGVIGGGIGINEYVSKDPIPVVVDTDKTEFKDTDTIGVLEPDR